jgi:hypothetical protein
MSHVPDLKLLTVEAKRGVPCTNKPIGMWRENQPVRTSKGKEEAGAEEE